MTPRSILRWSLFLALAGFATLQSSCAPTLGSFYRKCTRPKSYYRNDYCFELPKKDVLKAVKMVLQKGNFPLTSETPTNNSFSTRQVIMPRYSCNAKWAYAVGYEVTVKESKGKLDLSTFPKWVMAKKTQPLPKPPKRESFKTAEAFDKAYQGYLQDSLKRGETLEKFVSLMRSYQGCNVKTSTVRSMVTVKLKVTAYPVDSFGNINKEKGQTKTGDNTLEYATLREIGRKLGKAKFMPRMLR